MLYPNLIRRCYAVLKAHLPASWLKFYRISKLYPRDPLEVMAFLLNGWPETQLGLVERLSWVKNLYLISVKVTSPHSQAQMLALVEAIYQAEPGCLVEAGCFKGGSTAKLSLAARATGRLFYVFDSFAGLPDNIEEHSHSITGRPIGHFKPGSFRGGLAEVRSNIARFGAIEVCDFIPGWFDETMPHFAQPIAVAFVDVDLVSSTKTCLKYLYPLLIPGGVLFSHDGHLPLVVELFQDESFWRDEVGGPPPQIEGLGQTTLIKITKPA